MMNPENHGAGFLLDTDFLIDLNRGRRNNSRIRAEKLLLEIQAEKMLRELYFYLAPSFEEAALAGSLRREWLSRGHTPAIADVVNAALAISRNLI